MNSSVRWKTFADRLWGALAAALWLAGICYGFFSLARYDARPGLAANASTRFPAGSRIPAPAGKFEMVVFLHPLCPCSRATLDELFRLIGTAPGRFNTYVVFVRPPGEPVGWEHTALWNQAAQIPDASVMVDPGAVEAKRFDAHTSGQVMFYGPGGRLLFAGGITPQRGHEGDSMGRYAILADLAGEKPPAKWSQVYGCALYDEPVKLPLSREAP